jgi:hypothetical protein
MVYKSNLAVAIKVNGKVLREQGDLVTLPFGSEYSILLKNMDTVRVLAKISIDGVEVTDGSFILQPNSSSEIERFVKDLNKGNRFKFIERTEAVEQHRGVKVDDGLIRIEYSREKIAPAPVHVPVVYDYYPWPYWPFRRTYPYYGDWHTYNSCGDIQPLVTTTGALGNAQSYSGNISGASRSRGMNSGSQIMSFSCNNATMDATNASGLASNDVGITVPGSLSNQQFVTVSSFPTEEAKVLILRLRGKVGDKSVTKPVTVETKSNCTTCGRSNGSRNKFCYQCGTALEIV